MPDTTLPPPTQPISRLRGLFRTRLYLRIWLAVVGAVAILALLAGWAWRAADDARRASEATPKVREVIVRDPQGTELGRGQFNILRPSDDNPQTRFQLTLPDQTVYELQALPRRDHRPASGPPWARGPYATHGYLWLLAVVAVAVALGVFPLVRWLTARLERLQRSVAKWGAGDLSARATVQGGDEVATLARHFNDAADHIEALMNAQKSLLANASHELRSPLARIHIAVELMGDAPSPATRQEIKRNIAELDQLIDEILLASRLDAREADLGTEESVDMLGLLAEEAAHTGAEVQLEGAPDACQVQGIHKLLRRMVRNLLENARRYGMPDAATPIQALIAPTGNKLTIRISDHGPGVPPELRERIFEPFFRTPGASETSGGVGLGLALVKSIAERHGGLVRCESRPDGLQGASFVITLPLFSAT